MTWGPTINLVIWLLSVLLVYSAIGMGVGAAFVLRWVNDVDPGAARASIWVRLLLLPGAAALWPVMLRLWIKARRGGV